VVGEVRGEGGPVTPARIEAVAAGRGALTARVTDRRELPDASDDVEVSFADPDEAVRNRIEEMGLSPAARDLDETIRASKVADSNVADTVERRVEEFVDEADAGAFQPADDGPEVVSQSESDGEEQSADASEAPADGQVTMEDFL
jgi:hypothetical protein